LTSGPGQNFPVVLHRRGRQLIPRYLPCPPHLGEGRSGPGAEKLVRRRVHSACPRQRRYGTQRPRNCRYTVSQSTHNSSCLPMRRRSGLAARHSPEPLAPECVRVEEDFGSGITGCSGMRTASEKNRAPCSPQNALLSFFDQSLDLIAGRS
jgi:hypothetical protein